MAIVCIKHLPVFDDSQKRAILDEWKNGQESRMPRKSSQVPQLKSAATQSRMHSAAFAESSAWGEKSCFRDLFKALDEK